MKFQNLKNEIYYCLQHFPETRNSDIELTIKIWKKFYSKYLFVRPTSTTQTNPTYWIDLESLWSIPSQDDIKRLRAKIQNPNPTTNYQGMYPPTCWEVAKKRHWNEQQWHWRMKTN